MNTIVKENLQIIWDFMRLDMEPERCDCIVGFGCYNEDIAARCAELYHQGFGPKILFTGGLGRNTAELWTRSEAERFADVALAAGVPETDIIIENKATNSAENILFARKMLAELGLPVKRILAVHKPFMERRVMAAMGVYWPEIEAIYTSPRVDLETYIAGSVAAGMTEKGVIDVIVGDFQRMDVYARKGFQLPQRIPAACWEAFRNLVAMGHTGELVRE